MPHRRNRHLLPYLKQSLKYSPIVGVFGHRQVGKSTLMESLVDTYLTFDQASLRLAAQEDAEDFIYQHDLKTGTLGLDEAQMVPELFPVLKEHVRKHKRPGQFLLSGSVRFTSRKAIRESLTGRILNLELLPLTVSELGQLPSSLFLELMSSDHSFSSAIHTLSGDFSVRDQKTDKKWKLIDQYFLQGGLPGICFARDPKIRVNFMDSLIRTIIERDLPLVQATTLSPVVLFEFVSAIAKNGWEPLRFTALRKKTGISQITQKKILYALESVYLLRALPMEGDFKGPIYLFEDQFEQLFLSEYKLDLESQRIGLLYRNLRAYFHCRAGEIPAPFVFRKRGGANVPLAFRARQSNLGVVPLAKGDPTLSQLRSADSFLRKYGNGKVIFVSFESRKPEIISDRICLVDARTALFHA